MLINLDRFMKYPFSCLVFKLILKNKEIIKNYIKETLIGKKYLIENFKKLKIEFFPTNTNFILVKLDSLKTKEKIIKSFAKKNILVMGEGKLPEGYKILRITLGPKYYMEKVINVFKKFYG